MKPIPPLSSDSGFASRIIERGKAREAAESARKNRDVDDAIKRSAKANQFSKNNRSAGSRGYGG